MQYLTPQKSFISGVCLAGMLWLACSCTSAASPPPKPAASPRMEKFQVLMDVPAGIAPDVVRPVTFGVPFPRDALNGENQVRLVDAAGREIASQREITARWSPQGAIKWLRFDALLAPARGCFVAPAPAASTAPAPRLTLAENGDQIVIETGTARYVLGKGISPIIEIANQSGGKVVNARGTRGLYVVNQKGETASAAPDEETMEVEAHGPIAASVRFEGWYITAQGEKMARHITRVECFAGQAAASVTHTLILTRNTDEVWFKELGWELGVAGGAAPRALFARGRAAPAAPAGPETPTACIARPLSDTVPGAFVFQDQHYFFKHGTNHFMLGTLAANGDVATIFAGDEMGDWAALQGGAGGLAIACKDAARQHPKELEIRRDRMILKLFSNRAGDELDFRPATLVKKWDLPAWYENTHSARMREKGFVNKIAAQPSNAIGWSKTHVLLFLPLAPDTAAGMIAEAASLQNTPIYALADPWAIYASGAIGPLYPSVPEKFSIIEKAVDAAFRHFIQCDSAWGEHGFVDYFAGPHLVYHENGYAGMKRYNWATYTLRSDLWYLYARAGGREVRAFAEGCNRTFMDAILAHWDGKQTIRGLHRSSPEPRANLPFYWGDDPALEISSSSNFENIMLYYYLTGYRRARDCMLEYADGIKRAWSPEKAAQAWRPLMLFRLITQAYAFTLDPQLKELAEATFKQFADLETVLGLSKEFRPYGSTSYKSNVDVRAIIEAWQVFGNAEYREVALRLARYWWQLLGTPPVIYTNPQPRIGWFLYNETGQPAYAELLALQLRRLAQTYDPENDAIRPATRLAAHNVAFYLEGVPYALDVVTRAGADTKSLVSMLGYNDASRDTSIIVRKQTNATVKVQVWVEAGEDRAAAVGGTRVRILNTKTMAGLNFLRVTDFAPDFQGYHPGSAEVLIPKDAPAGDYEILPRKKGAIFAIADSQAPMVFYAPGYWLPTLRQTPPERYYFSLPEDSADAQIFFEGTAKLFAPDGAPLFDGQPRHGWVDLPAGQPGLWSFAPVDNMLVRVRNIPPFFAVNAPANYFMPADKPWSREPKPAPPRSYPPDTRFGPGAIDLPDNQALYLAGLRALVLQPGAPHPSGNGGQFLPWKEGTIEFWFKPAWSSAELMTPEIARSDKSSIFKRLIFAPMDAPDTDAVYTLDYTIMGSAKYLRGSFLTDGQEGRKNMRTYYQGALFEHDQWVHIAWVWGPRNAVRTNRVIPDTMMADVFVNGQRLSNASIQYQGNTPATPMQMLYLGYKHSNMDAFVDELRISGNQRYQSEFNPPRRDGELQCDEHTRALFHFNGDIKGRSFGFEGELPVVLEEK